MTRGEAIELLNQYIKNERMLNHCYASEAVMKALARRLGKNEEEWGITGLLHDLDLEITNADLSIHTRETEKILSEKGVDPEIIDAIKMHNEEAWGMKRNTVFHHALAAGETVTGMIVAAALVYPDKKLASVKAKSVTKRMKEKAFAASVNRDTIMECERIGLPLDEFVEICLQAMKEISDQLGL
ncbi:MAG: HDIG domain-containing protein [Deltaproteobacteria bacterium]|nr:HDIG domain-containing protein [Deltaproteobacteria bacterium]